MSDTERKNAKEGKLGFPERICRALDIEPDVLPHASLVEIRGRSAVSVSGGGKILEYTDDEIKLALKNGAVVIRGKRLVCASFCAGKVRIEGRIECVSFEEYDKKTRKGGKGTC